MRHSLIRKMKNTFRGGINQRSEFLPQEIYELKVHLARDDETGRWYVANSDIPGLRLEADNPMDLIARIQDAAPELLELNGDEVLEACRARNPQPKKKAAVQAEKRAPSILPIFDSPMQLAPA